MQYQIYEKDTRELIAWIDTESDNIVLHNGYDVQSGGNLRVVDVDGDIKPCVEDFSFVFTLLISTDHYSNMEVLWNADTVAIGKAEVPVKVLEAMRRIYAGEATPVGREYTGSGELMIANARGDYVDSESFTFNCKYPWDLNELHLA